MQYIVHTNIFSNIMCKIYIWRLNQQIFFKRNYNRFSPPPAGDDIYLLSCYPFY